MEGFEFPADLTVQHEGQNIPISQHPAIKGVSADLTRRYVELAIELGWINLEDEDD